MIVYVVWYSVRQQKIVIRVRGNRAARREKREWRRDKK